MDLVQVAIKVRPPSKPRSSLSINKNSNQLTLKSTTFSFDHVFDSADPPHKLYQTCAYPLLSSFLNGYNITLFAYGQTGTGKSYTMGTRLDSFGLLQHFCLDLFKELKDKTKIKCSFIEVYQENVVDLLATDKTELSIRMASDGSVEMGEEQISVSCLEEIINVLEKGKKRRATASTQIHSESSRSHAILTIHLETHYFHSKCHLVDLAGSERVKRTGAEGMRFKESIKINGGLLALGNVMNALSLNGQDEEKYVGYRDSKLTRLLKDSLGGNCKTLMIACVSPDELDEEETMNSLKWAERAKSIRNKPIVVERKEKVAVVMECLRAQTIKNASKLEIDEIVKNKLRVWWMSSRG